MMVIIIKWDMNVKGDGLRRIYGTEKGERK
jgi:hypothetical protein